MTKKGRDGNKNPLKIGNKTLGKQPYIIAEFGVNHGNSLEVAKEGIKAAAKAGADAIKFQTYTADELVCKGTPKFWDHKSAEGMDQHQAYKKIGGFPFEYYPELISFCESQGIEFLSTPFSFLAADRLNNLGMRAFKVASSDMSTTPLLRQIARYNKPILLSTGASTMEEIRASVKAILEEGNEQIVIMHCILSYPTKARDANLSTITTLKGMYPKLEVGISDHTLGLASPIVASALGASVIEKHFTLDKTLTDTADHWLSVDPGELKQLVELSKDAWVSMGEPRDSHYPCEANTRKYDKRSVVSKVRIRKGTTIKESMITFKRPGTGIWPSNARVVVGAVAKKNIPKDVPIRWGMI